MTFVRDFRVYASELVFSFTEDIENILPQIETFLDTLNEITNTQFYFEVDSKRIGVLKIFDVETITFNKDLIFQTQSQWKAITKISNDYNYSEKTVLWHVYRQKNRFILISRAILASNVS